MPEISPQTNGVPNGEAKPVSATTPAVQPAQSAAASQPVVVPANPAPAAVNKPAEAPAAPTEPGTFNIASAKDQVRPSILQSLLFNKNLPAGTQQRSAPSLAALLGPKPVFSKAAFEEVEKKRVRFARNIFKLSIVLMFGVFVFFYSQLNANFTWFSGLLGANPAQEFKSSNDELKSLKTKLNLINFRTAKYWLEEANSYVDSFQRLTAVVKSDFSTKSEKQNAKTELSTISANIKKALTEVKNILNQPLGIAVYSTSPVSPEQTEQEFEDLLKAELTKQRAEIAVDPKLNSEELALFDGVIQFVESKKFRDAIRSADLANIPEEDFARLITRIREQATDELSAIEKIRKTRLDWAEVINNIHAVTRRADPYYGQGAFKTLGGFLFNSYNFDSQTGKISISGVTKTSDSKTFSFIAKLVDSIEKSPIFKNIDFRSFSKSRDEIGDFSSSINLEFELQKAEEVDSRDDTAASFEPTPAVTVKPAPEEVTAPTLVPAEPAPVAPPADLTTPTENLG
ncbi:MAG: hypothetical protein WCT53_04955 [Candidatus Gracilibacteria bacterium]